MMLFGGQNDAEIDETVALLQRSMEHYPYHLAGEECMLLAKTHAEVLRYTFAVPSDGPLESVRFRQGTQRIKWSPVK